jgi:hypothetical protein
MALIYFGGSINTTKTTEIVINAGKEVEIEVNVKKTKHRFISRHQNRRKNHSMK